MDSETWVKRHPRLIIFSFTLLLIMFLELLTGFLMRQGVIPYDPLPTSSETSMLYGDLSPYYGVWRHPNRSVRHVSPCFDVNYTSNSYGARDSERAKTSILPRAVVLGDSFVDGYGVDLKDRMTNIAEGISDMDFLNFGTAGNFGPTQQWLLYRELASKFDHEEVHIFFFPSNDFDENDPDKFPAKRYRPYLRKNKNSDYEVYYTVEFADRMVPVQMSRWRRMRRILYNNIYILNLIRQVGTIFESSEFKDDIADSFKSNMSPSYDDYNKEELDTLLYAYQQIIKIAGEKKVRIFVVPREKEFLQYNMDKPFKLIDDMKKFASKHKNLEIHDLLLVFIKYASEQNVNYEDFFLKCDDHWSPLGNKIIGEYLANIVDA